MASATACRKSGFLVLNAGNVTSLMSIGFLLSAGWRIAMVERTFAAS